MKLGEVFNEAALQWGRPLDGVKVLSFEQYIAAPFTTQMLTRLGAEVVKVEPPGTGEPARLGQPSVVDASGRRAGTSLLRFNLGKRSIEVDVKKPRGRDLIHALVPHFDIVCENLGPRRAEKRGLGYGALSAINPRLIYLSITGFGQGDESPYANWPAMAGVAEAMCGVADYARRPNEPPTAGRYGPLADMGTAVFGALGVVAALRHRDRMGKGQHVDVALLDSMLALCDYLPNFWSLGMRKAPDTVARSPGIITTCRAKDGWFTLHALRRHQFERLANTIGRPEWLSDKRLVTLMDWTNRLDDTINPAIEAWASDKTKLEAARLLSEAGVPSAPCNTVDEIVRDPHFERRRMLVELPRTDGSNEPVLVAGNPIKMSRVAEGPESSFPLLGEHTERVLTDLLKLDAGALAELRQAGVIG
jgi:crotonobetainyl-CoA:carnitine CoA-transferase CaiB-like acyl-CoA transferase